MINQIALFAPLVSFFVTLFLLPFWIRKARQIGLVWEDMNKNGVRGISGSGGVMVILGFVLGLMTYITYRTFYLHSGNEFFVEILSLFSVILLLAGLGFMDDLFGWRKGGLSRRSRIILVFLASIPLIAINAGKSEIIMPFYGVIDLGLIYPFFLVPLGIIGATTTFNFLAGFNGLEAGQGILILGALSGVAFLTGSGWLAAVALCMIFALLAFLIFNISPAKVFPGDVLTYPVGGLIALMAILGDFERIAVFFFIPVILEFFLKARGKFVKQSFGLPNEDGSLKLRYDKIYSLNHLAIYLMEKKGIKPTEMKVVLSIWIFQLIIILLGFFIFRAGIF
ncbi:MAG: glycosyl transferase family 4 [Nanoarchaeota archaeon]|nr:glycosyl transferase family 4 [Nanoarchaeota archaeon]